MNSPLGQFMYGSCSFLSGGLRVLFHVYMQEPVAAGVIPLVGATLTCPSPDSFKKPVINCYLPLSTVELLYKDIPE